VFPVASKTLGVIHGCSPLVIQSYTQRDSSLTSRTNHPPKLTPRIFDAAKSHLKGIAIALPFASLFSLPAIFPSAPIESSCSA
jgi:hypothetical protein